MFIDRGNELRLIRDHPFPPDPPIDSLYYKDAARWFEINPYTLWQFIQDGAIKRYWEAGRVVCDIKEVASLRLWLEMQKTGTEST